MNALAITQICIHVLVPFPDLPVSWENLLVTFPDLIPGRIAGLTLHCVIKVSGMGETWWQLVGLQPVVLWSLTPQSNAFTTWPSSLGTPLWCEGPQVKSH